MGRWAAAWQPLDWRLAAASGLAGDVDERRVEATVALGRSGRSLPEDVVTSLNGVWRLQPTGGEERDIDVGWRAAVAAIEGVEGRSEE